MLDALLQEARYLAGTCAVIRSLIDLDRTDNALRFRLVINDTIFIQVYANTKNEKANFALISLGQRIYGRDSDGGIWHKHPFESPEDHQFEGVAGQPVTLTEFVVEVEDLLLKELIL